MPGNKILVTGADGFIGSHLTEHLLRLGCDVRAFVLYNSFNSWGWLDALPADLRRDLDVFAGDIRDPHGVRAAMRGCQAVLHLAALIAIPYSYHSPDTYVDTNIKGTLNILQAARELGVSRVVHTSTSEVYGTARFVPITEDHPLQGQSPLFGLQDRRGPDGPWPFTPASTRRSASSGPLTPTVPASRPGRSFPRSSPRLPTEPAPSNSAPCTRPGISIS